MTKRKTKTQHRAGGHRDEDDAEEEQRRGGGIFQVSRVPMQQLRSKGIAIFFREKQYDIESLKKSPFLQIKLLSTVL